MKDSGEEFARRVSLLMDLMNSASIDVQKILSDEVDDKAWNHYLKGNRGVFYTRAVRLLGGIEPGRLRNFESDHEFQNAVNHYVHDFEAMLRRVLAERDGGNDRRHLDVGYAGKLYAALAQAVDSGGRSQPRVEVISTPIQPNCSWRHRVRSAGPRPPPPETNASANRTCAARCRLAPHPVGAPSSVPHPEREQQESREAEKRGDREDRGPFHRQSPT